MHGLSPTDPGRSLDWSHAAEDYARYRTGYPASFWTRLESLGIVRPGLRVLDLGTGTGVIARSLARRGCQVVGIDVAAGQIEAARELAGKEGLAVDFRVGPAEETGLPTAAFDLVTASQCWLYFDKPRAIAEVKRVLAPGGRLVTCHLSWMPRRDDTAARTEALVLQHNPQWSAGDWNGRIPAIPEWARDHLDVEAMFWYDEPIPFTRESWRGRMRACRGIGASLTPAAIQAFDRELAEMLERTVPEEFTILHRIDAHVFLPAESRS